MVRASNGLEASLPLHPWNHAPMQLPHADFDQLREWHMQTLQTQHSHISDVLSGRRLDVLEQCITMDVKGYGDVAGVIDARTLAAYLSDLHGRLCKGGPVSRCPCTLLTAAPAAGKTCLVSQVIMSLRNTELVPILVKVQSLVALLAAKGGAFVDSWNCELFCVSASYEMWLSPAQF
jgi:hypothetical protein